MIVDDVAYFEEPFFQDGPVADAIDEVDRAGVTYFSAAGNDNLFDARRQRNRLLGSAGIPRLRQLPAGRRSDCAELQRRPLHGLQPRTGDRPTFGITVEPGETLTVDLQWAEPWTGSRPTSTPTCSTPTAKSYRLNRRQRRAQQKTERQGPVEIVQWENETGAASTVKLVDQPLLRHPDPGSSSSWCENGGGVSATEYPKSSRRRRGRSDHLRPHRRRQRDRRRGRPLRRQQ